MAKESTPSSRNRDAFQTLTETAGNVPPQAIELEEAVLGALMLEKDSIIAVQEYVVPEAFYTEEHRLIYKAIEELSTELKPVDLYTVTERLKAKKELKKVGGASYLAQLTQKVGSAANVEFHAKIIAQKYVQRELIRSATEIQRRSYDESTDVTELIGYAEARAARWPRATSNARCSRPRTSWPAPWHRSKRRRRTPARSAACRRASWASTA